MDRLRRLLYEEAEEQRKRHTKAIRKTYRDQLKEIQQEKEREKTAQHKRKLPVGHKLLLFGLLSIEVIERFFIHVDLMADAHSSNEVVFFHYNTLKQDLS